MSRRTIMQLYKDVERFAQQTPGQFADSAMMELFNANLVESKKAHSNNPIVEAIKEVSGQVRLRDLLVRVGQLQAAIFDIEGAGYL